MTTIPLPRTIASAPVNWRKSPISRRHVVAPQSSAGKISYDLWDEIQKQKIKTITTPPDDVRLERELADILQECSSPDWNGYDAQPIERKSIEHICAFLAMLPDNISYPELCAEPNGDLTMVRRKRGYH